MKYKYLVVIIVLLLFMNGCNSSKQSQIVRQAANDFTVETSITESIPVASRYLFEDFAISVTWTSSNTDIISNEGIVFRSDESQEVTLTYTLSFGSKSQNKSFDVTVEKLTENDKTVQFMTNDGLFDIVYLEKGSALGEVNSPEEDNSFFIGWFIDENKTQLFKEDSLIDVDLTLYANCKFETYEIDIIYPGFEEYNQHLTLDTNNIINMSAYPTLIEGNDYDVFVTADDYIIESIVYDTPTGTLADFDWDESEHTINLYLSKIEYSIRYYDESSDEVTIEQTFLSKTDGQKYYIDSNNMVYQNVLKLGQLDMADTDKVSDFIALGFLVVIITEEGKVFSFSKGEFANKYQSQITDYGYVSDIIGSIQYVKYTSNRHPLVIVGTKGIIEFGGYEIIPRIYTWELYGETIEDVITVNGYFSYIVITSEQKVYSTQSRYLEQPDLLPLQQGEIVEHIYDTNYSSLLFTNFGRVIESQTFQYETFLSYDLSDTFHWTEDERVVDIINDYILTTENKLYKIQYDNDPDESGFDIQLIEVFDEADYATSIINRNEEKTTYLWEFMFVVTNNGYVYYEIMEEINQMLNVTLDEGEEILYFHNNGNTITVITNKRNFIYSVEEGTINENVYDQVLAQFSIEDIYEVSGSSDRGYHIVTNDFQNLTLFEGEIIEEEITFYNITEEIFKSYGESLNAPYEMKDFSIYRQYQYGSQYGYVNGNVDIYTRIIPYRISLFLEYNDPNQEMNSYFFDMYSIPELEVPTREGYIFDGWYMDGFFTIPYAENLLVLGEHYDLYAKWIPVT